MVQHRAVYFKKSYGLKLKPLFSVNLSNNFCKLLKNYQFGWHSETIRIIQLLWLYL